MQEFEKFAKNGFVKGKKMGFNDMEFFVMRSKSLGVSVKDANVEETNIADVQGIGVRVIRDKHWGYAYSADFSPNSLQNMLDIALRNTHYTDRDEYAILPNTQPRYRALGLYDDDLAKISLDSKIDLAKTCEQVAKQSDNRVIQIDKATYYEGESEVWIANSNNLFAYEKSTYCSLACIAIGEDGNGRDSGYGRDTAVRLKNLNPQKVGTQAANRAVRMLSAKNVENMTCDIILPPESAVEILELIAGSFAGDSVLKGRSMFNNLNEQIASHLVSIVDDGTMADGLGSSEFDGEGVATSKTVLVDNGVLNAYLYDTKNANEANTISTGNAMRGSYRSAPYIDTTNLYIAEGSTKASNIVKDSALALYVTDILGGHTANTITGDFSFGVAGFLVKRGQIMYAVRGCTMAGNFKDMLNNIDMVGDDLTFFASTGAPTLRVRNVKISG